jgi:hypothetical protein
MAMGVHPIHPRQRQYAWHTICTLPLLRSAISQDHGAAERTSLLFLLHYNCLSAVEFIERFHRHDQVVPAESWLFFHFFMTQKE